MNNDIKISKHYSSSKMLRAIMLMEQFWMLSQDKSISEKESVSAKALFEHYRRLAMCILMKEMPKQMTNDLIIDVEYMKNIYKKYAV